MRKLIYREWGDSVFLENFVPILVPHLDDVRTYFIDNLSESRLALTIYLQYLHTEEDDLSQCEIQSSRQRFPVMLG
jgi:hypothetical protein